MAEEFQYTDVAYCNRCDRGFVGGSNVSYLEAYRASRALLEAHVVKHPDYVPELHSEIDPE